MTLMGLKALMAFKELLTVMIVMYLPASCRKKSTDDIGGLQRIDDTDNGDDDDVPTSQLPRRRNASPEVVCPAKPPQA